MQRKTLLTLILICFSFLSSTASADSDSERENLSRIIREIDYLIGEVSNIKKDAPDNQRINFEYNMLIDDLIKVRQGISDHINSSLDASRPIKPLNGVYSR